MSYEARNRRGSAGGHFGPAKDGFMLSTKRGRGRVHPAFLALILLGWFPLFGSSPALGQGLQAGLDFLATSQNADGTWGEPSATQFRDTAVVLDTLRLLGKTGQAFSSGAAGIESIRVRNNDDLARQTPNLAAAGRDVAVAIDALLVAQGSEILDPTDASFPGRGWGIANGYAGSPLDTALVLRGLRAGNLPSGLSVVREQIPAAAASSPHPFQLPAGAAAHYLKVRQVSGSARFTLTLPNSTSIYADVSPAGAPVSIGPLPVDAGQWALTIRNLTALPITCTAEVAFTTADGFDASRATTPHTYLGLVQNSDGGWGIAAGQDSHLMVTDEVLQTLASTKGFAGPGVLSAATAWLLSNHRNPDGGFSSEPGASNVNETALSTVAIGLADPAVDLSAPAAFLAAAQLPNGSWGDDPYLTAVAMQALLLTTPRGPPAITSNGGAGSGAGFVTDDRTVTISGTLPLGVVNLLVNNPSAVVVIDAETGTFRITLTLTEGSNAVTLTSVDGFGNSGAQTSLNIAVDSTLLGQDLALVPDMNLIGLRLDPANPTGAIDLLQMLGPNARQVQRLDPTSGVYETTERTGAGFTGSNFPLDGLDGLIVVTDAADGTPIRAHLAGRPAAATTVDLLAGVNTITVPDPPAGLNAFDLLALIGGETVVSALQRLDPASGRFQTAAYRDGVPVGVPFPIEAGTSYFAFLRQNVLGFVLPVGVVVEVQIASPANGATLTTSPVVVSGTVIGEAPIAVVVNGVPATVAAGTFSATVPLSPGLNTITAAATDAGGRTGSGSISVTLNPVDYSISRGGTASGSRIFTGASSVLDQTAYFTENKIGVPAGVTYQTTSVSRISATQIQVGFRIDVALGAVPGIYTFQVDYGLLDAASNPLGPLVGNVFDFQIEVKP